MAVRFFAMEKIYPRQTITYNHKQSEQEPELSHLSNCLRKKYWQNILYRYHLRTNHFL